MKGPTLLGRTSIRGFPPRTSGKEDVEKKREVRDRLKAQIDDLPVLQKACRGRRLSVDVAFYLYGKSAVLGRKAKDLDNLLKIVLDTLPEYMDRGKKELGLGLIEEDRDDFVFDLHAVKRMVENEDEEGIDIEISEWIDAATSSG